MILAKGLITSATVILAALSAGPAVAATGTAAAPPGGQLTFTDFVIPGAQYTHVTGVSDSGKIAGYYGDATGQHGFIDNHGQITKVDAPGATITYLTAINDAGVVTGAYWDGSDVIEHGFIRDANGAFTPLDEPDVTPGDQWGTYPGGVSNSGVVVGYYFTTDFDGLIYPDGTTGSSITPHGFTWQRGQFTTYDAPGAAGPIANSGVTELLGISDSGAMVGSANYMLSADMGTGLGFVVTRGNFRTFSGPISRSNWCGWVSPAAINDAGTIAGDSGNGCGGMHEAWLLNGDVFTSVDYPGATQTVVSSINNKGVIGGTWTSDTGQVDGFIAGQR